MSLLKAFSAFPTFPALVASVSLLAGASSAQAREMVSVDKPVINMRVGAGTRTSAVWKLYSGYPLEVTEHKGQWLKVRDFEGDGGWVYGPLTGKKRHHIVKVDIANMRSSPSTGARLIDKLERGEVVQTLERRQNWVKVQEEGGMRGWIARRLLWGW